MNAFQRMADELAAAEAVETDAVETDAVAMRERERKRIIEAEAAAFEAAEVHRMDRAEAMERTRAIDAEWEADIRREEAVALARARRLARPTRVKLKPGSLEKKLRTRRRVEDDPAPAEAEVIDMAAEVQRREAERERNFTVMKGDRLGDHYLTVDHLKRSYGAVAFLNCMGKTFNVFYTFTLESMYIRGCSDEKADEDIKKHLKHLSGYFRYREEKMYFLRVFERGKKRGIHFHCLLHVPERLLPGLEGAIEQSIWTTFRERPRRPAKHVKGADPSAALDDTKTIDIQINTTFDLQWRRWRYLFEGISPAITVSVLDRPSWDTTPLRDYLKLEKMSHQGRYTKGRFGWSSTWLGEKARDEFEAKYGKMPNALLNPDNLNNPHIPHDPEQLYGSQYFDWYETNVKGRDGPGRLLSSLDLPW